MHPEWVIETPAHHGEFRVRLPRWRRLLRFPARMAVSLLKGHWLWQPASFAMPLDSS